MAPMGAGAEATAEVVGETFEIAWKDSRLVSGKDVFQLVPSSSFFSAAGGCRGLIWRDQGDRLGAGAGVCSIPGIDFAARSGLSNAGWDRVAIAVRFFQRSERTPIAVQHLSPNGLGEDSMLAGDVTVGVRKFRMRSLGRSGVG